MTVLETELSPSRHSFIPSPDFEHLARPSAQSLVLFCPNINALELPHFQKADQLLHQMALALGNECVDAFNETRQQLICLLKKHAEPVTQWNPLILDLSSAQALQGRSLSQINFSMTRLRAADGVVSLERTNLQSANLLCADFSHVSLASADLSGADCRYADFRDVNLFQAALVESDLSHAKLSLANLVEADLYCAKLNGALMKQTSLHDVNLRKADLRNADLYQADLRFARLQSADLREANLFMADLTGAKLRQTDLRKAHLSFCSLKDARLPNARLEGTNLTNANLSKADLQKCRLSGSLLSRAQLTDAKMNFTCLQSADLAEAIGLETAALQGATFDQNTAFPKGFKARRHGMLNVRCSVVQGLFRWMAERFQRKRA